MRPPANLILIGLRGSGKSTVGRQVAARLARPFVDLDDVTPGLLGASGVREAWERFGEGAFRRAEADAAARVLDAGGRVVALGGGTPTAPGVADLLLRERRDGRAVVVYLRASAETLRRRLEAADHTDRPSLTGAGVTQEVAAVLAARDAPYRRLADHVVECDTLTVEQTTDAVLRSCGAARG